MGVDSRNLSGITGSHSLYLQGTNQISQHIQVFGQGVLCHPYKDISRCIGYPQPPCTAVVKICFGNVMHLHILPARFPLGIPECLFCVDDNQLVYGIFLPVQPVQKLSESFSRFISRYQHIYQSFPIFHPISPLLWSLFCKIKTAADYHMNGIRRPNTL